MESDLLCIQFRSTLNVYAALLLTSKDPVTSHELGECVVAL